VNAVRTTRARSDEGASAVEYALVVSAIAAVIVAVVFGLGQLSRGHFSETCTTIVTATSSGGSC
jgi:pilus assembly protein Flp/PilA